MSQEDCTELAAIANLEYASLVEKCQDLLPASKKVESIYQALLGIPSTIHKMAQRKTPEATIFNYLIDQLDEAKKHLKRYY